MERPAAPWRKTTQAVAPARPPHTAPGQYDIYPGFPVRPGAIGVGYDALAARLAGGRRVILDGYGGVLWPEVRRRLDAAVQARGIRAAWTPIDAALRPAPEIDALIAPSLGGDDPLFGTRFPGALRDFFDPEKLAALQPDPQAGLHIVYGTGAALAGWDGLLVYVDVPKNEIQFRGRAGSIVNLGARADGAGWAYKRAYFVDWVALNRHKAALLPQIDLIVDEQRPAEPTVMGGADLRAGLHEMSRNYFRVRPWFEPGPWGGAWIKRHIPELPQDTPNYAWSLS